MISNIPRILDEISNDTREGATTLALRGLDALELVADEFALERESLSPEQARQTVVDLVRSLGQVRPSISSIGAQAVIALAKAKSMVADGASWDAALKEAVRQERESLGRATGAIASLAVKQLGTGGALATCSWSMTVLKTLLSLMPEQVYIGEGHKLGDGLKAARWLVARGLNVEVVPDGSLPLVVEQVRGVVVGADQILADGTVVNRASTFAMALAAQHFTKPFYAVCHKIKLAGMTNIQLEDGPGFIQELPAGVTGSAPLFDLTPASLVHRVITEVGVFTSQEAGEIGRGIAGLRSSLLG